MGLPDDPDAAWRPAAPVGPSGAPVGSGVSSRGTEQVAGLSDLVEIARGGDSIVYRAHQDGLGRDVAVKVLLVDDPETVARFQREVELTVALGRQHPNIVTLLDTRTTDSGRPCIVMDLFERGSVGDRLGTEGPLPVADVIAVGIVVADALEFAHTQGVLHRDVKPQNILVLPTSYVLADFGIARLADSAHTASAERFSYRHASPQVLDGLPATASDDVWSLGSTLFTLLDGRPPFASDDPTDDSALAYLRRVRTQDPRTMTRDDVPAALTEVIGRCLARERADRYADAQALHDALSRVRSGLQVWAPVEATTVVTEADEAAEAAAADVPEPAGTEVARAVEATPETGTASAWAPPAARTAPPGGSESLPPPATEDDPDEASPVVSPDAAAAVAAPRPAATESRRAPSALSHAREVAGRDTTPTGLSPEREPSAGGPEAGDDGGTRHTGRGGRDGKGGRGRLPRFVVVGSIACVALGIVISAAYSLGRMGQRTPVASTPTIATPTTGGTVGSFTSSPGDVVSPRAPVADPSLAAPFDDLRSTGTGVTLTWTDPSGGKGTFIVTQTTPLDASGKPEAVRNLPAGVTTTTIDGLTPGSGERCYVIVTFVSTSSAGTSAQRCITL